MKSVKLEVTALLILFSGCFGYQQLDVGAETVYAFHDLDYYMKDGEKSIRDSFGTNGVGLSLVGYNTGRVVGGIADFQLTVGRHGALSLTYFEGYSVNEVSVDASIYSGRGFLGAVYRPEDAPGEETELIFAAWSKFLGLGGRGSAGFANFGLVAGVRSRLYLKKEAGLSENGHARGIFLLSEVLLARPLIFSEEALFSNEVTNFSSKLFYNYHWCFSFGLYYQSESSMVGIELQEDMRSTDMNCLEAHVKYVQEF